MHVDGAHAPAVALELDEHLRGCAACARVASRLREEAMALRAALKTEIVAELDGAQKQFGTLVALHALDLQIAPGELLGLLGSNGAGKSTAISLLIGLSRPDAGRAFLFGRSPHDIEARRQIGVMLQAAELIPELRVRELIELTAKYYPEPMELEEALAVSGTASIVNRPYGKLSGGQRRLVQFALAICGRPRLLFLDEPTAGLDIEAREVMWATLRQLVSQGVAIVLTTHYLEEAESLSDRVAVLSKGRLVAQGSLLQIRELTIGKQIDCTTSMDATEVDAWPEVERACRDARGLHIRTRNAEAVARRLLAADRNLADLEIRKPGLAETFKELAREQRQ